MGYPPVVSRKRERDLIDQDQPRRDETWQHLLDNAPEDALQRLAYWTAIRDAADLELYPAAEDARRAGHSWHVLGMAYGERSAQAAQKRFSDK